MNTTQKRSFGRRINAWLDEPDGEQFTDGKWRFWLPAVLGFSILNAALTVMIFRESASANYLTPALLAASAIVSWIAIGCLHYSDAKRGRMARGVSALDSASLLFVIGHFCFLVYILGHGWILRGAEAQYRNDLAKYNANAQTFHAGNEKIAEALRETSANQKEAARLEADRAYWERKSGKRSVEKSGGITANIELAKVELPPPPKAPEDTQAAFLTRWDAWVRITNFGELILAAITLIFIRNWTAKANTQPEGDQGDQGDQIDTWPEEIEAGAVEKRSSKRRENFTQKKEPTKNHGSFNSEGLKRLREALRDISFRLAGFSFKSNVKDDCVWIFLMRANAGTQETVASAKAKLSLLDDAMSMERTAFRERLEKFLRENGFEL
jgi:hypothetical protein